MDLTHLTRKEVGQIVAVLARLGISRDDMSTIFGMNTAAIDVRLKDAGYLRLSNVPGWQRGLARHWAQVKSNAEQHLENLNLATLSDNLTDLQRETVRKFLTTWLTHQKDVVPYQGYHPKCNRKKVVIRLYQLGIMPQTIAYITGYDRNIIQLDLSGLEQRSDRDQTYAHAFLDYAENVTKSGSGIPVEEGIEDAIWYCKILERYLEKNEIFAYALGAWQTIEALEVPSFTPKQEPHVRLYLALIRDPILLERHDSREGTAREIRNRFELYVRSVEAGRISPPKNTWEIIPHLTAEIIQDARDRVWPAWKQEWCATLEQLFAELSDSRRYAIREFYGFNGIPASPNEIAEKIGVSRSHVDQIIKDALQEMRRKSSFQFLSREIVPFGKVGEAQAELQEDLREAVEMIENMRRTPVSPDGEPDYLSSELNENLFKRVEELELSVRSANCLQNAGIEWIYQLVERNEAEMLKTKNLGRKSLNEMREILASMGLSLGMTLPKVTPFHPPKG